MEEVVLTVLSIFILGKPPTVIYRYGQFIADMMHEQFTRQPTKRLFKYSYVLFHMFLYYQSEKFPFTLQKLDNKVQPRSVIFWIPLIHQYQFPYSYYDFIDLFLHLVMEMLIGSRPPKINPKIKSVLQLSK